MFGVGELCVQPSITSPVRRLLTRVRNRELWSSKSSARALLFG